jgi:hypothetical protein
MPLTLLAANKIVDKFLRESSPHEINVSSTKTKSLLENLSNEIVSSLTFQLFGD